MLVNEINSCLNMLLGFILVNEINSCLNMLLGFMLIKRGVMY